MIKEKKSSPKTMTAEQLAEYYKKKWQDAAVPMEEGEYAVQMVNHNWYYFITNYSRIFSVCHKKCKELVQYDSVSKCTKTKTSGKKQLGLALQVGGKTSGYLRTSRLMEEYFSLSHFNPNQEETDRHHIEPYDVEKGKANNRVENLQCVGKKVHQCIFSKVQNATLTPKGMELKNEKNFLKNMAEMGEHLESPVLIYSKVDRETGEVKAVWGEELTEEDCNTLIRNNWDKLKDLYHVCQEYNTAYQSEAKRQQMRADMKRLEEHPEDVVRIDTANQRIIFKGEEE